MASECGNSFCVSVSWGRLVYLLGLFGWQNKYYNSSVHLEIQLGLHPKTCDLCPKFPPALRGVLGVKSLALGRHLVHRLSLQKFHRCQVAQC